MEDFIKQLRKEKNLTQEELGERLGLSKQIISHWESGRRTPTPLQRADLAKFFRIKESDFFTQPAVIKNEYIIKAFGILQTLSKDQRDEWFDFGEYLSNKKGASNAKDKNPAQQGKNNIRER